ncbi:MAG: DUF4810 domain-containing protein [Bacteroidales bacterium]|jgi:hypothetical protein|nr:DUF4810 domain-containing protein [Bacteroidales bacterium]
MRKILILLIITVVFAGCKKTLYLYQNYSELTYTYAKGGWDDKEVKRLTKQYKTIVELPKKSTFVPPPGCSADYACMMLRQGDTVKAKEYFDKEMLLYPESRTYVEKVKKDLGL